MRCLRAIVETEQRKAVSQAVAGEMSVHTDKETQEKKWGQQGGTNKMILSRMKFMSGSPTRPLSPNSSSPLDEILVHTFIILLLS